MTDPTHLYVELAHDVERFAPGYIDGYYGPEKWKGAGTRSLDEIAAAVTELQAQIAEMADEERRTFLTAQVTAMQTLVALKQGEAISYLDEVRLLYDVEPRRVDEREFEEALTALEDILPGTGLLPEREQALRQQFTIPKDQLLRVIGEIVPELRRRTLALVELPEGESFNSQLVNDQPWSAYNWYLGNYQSRVDYNTDTPVYLIGLPDTVAHEGYPGHHTEHALKEALLWHEQGRAEHSILLINAPECVISEGIATMARQAIMSKAELREWMVTELADLAGLTDAPFEAMFAAADARRVLRYVSNNAALLYHAEGGTDEDVIAYFMKYRLATEAEARKGLRFLSHPTFRSYGFTYTAGGDLLEQLFDRADGPAYFKRLLTEPITPATLRGWVAELQAENL